MSTRKTVICQSGLTGWQDHLQNLYDNFEEFKHYSSVHGLLKRLNFATEQEAWDANPLVEGSVEPSDYRCSPKGPHGRRRNP